MLHSKLSTLPIHAGRLPYYYGAELRRTCGKIRPAANIKKRHHACGHGRLLEVVDDRHQRGSTIITSQVPIENWHEIIADPTSADAVLDRLVHNAHRLALKGDSMRKITAQRAQENLTQFLMPATIPGRLHTHTHTRNSWPPSIELFRSQQLFSNWQVFFVGAAIPNVVRLPKD